MNLTWEELVRDTALAGRRSDFMEAMAMMYL